MAEPQVSLRLVQAGDARGPEVGGTAETDRDLVEAARSGDRAAFARLYERFAPMVHAVVLSRVEAADAEDVTQEVFLKAMRRLASLRDAGAVGPWLAAMARNRATSLVRWRARLRRLVLVRPPGPRAREGGLSAEEVLAAIRRLPGAYRETLIMRLVAQMSGPEIAARTGLSHGSVRVNLSRGMGLLRKELGSEVVS